MRLAARPVLRSVLRRDRRMRTERARRNLSRPVLGNSPSASPAGPARFPSNGRPHGRNIIWLRPAALRRIQQAAPGQESLSRLAGDEFSCASSALTPPSFKRSGPSGRAVLLSASLGRGGVSKRGENTPASQGTSFSGREGANQLETNDEHLCRYDAAHIEEIG